MTKRVKTHISVTQMINGGDRTHNS